MKVQDPKSGMPLRVQTLEHYKLLGDLTTAGIRSKLRDPKNGFYAIKIGGTEDHPYYGYELSDIIRYWRDVCKHPDAENFVNSLIEKAAA